MSILAKLVDGRLPLNAQPTPVAPRAFIRAWTTDDGRTFLGLLLDVEGLAAFLAAFGRGGSKPKLGADDVPAAVMDRREIVGLANGWHLRRSLQMGAPRLELVGPVDLGHEQVKAWGVLIEIVGFRRATGRRSIRIWRRLKRSLTRNRRGLRERPWRPPPRG